MTGEMGSCFGRKGFLLRVVPEPESGRYAVIRGGTVRNFVFPADFREDDGVLWTGSISCRELK